MKTENNITFDLKYRVTFCTKYRRGVLVDGVAERLKNTIVDVVAAGGGETLTLAINADSVTATLGIGPQFGIHRLVKMIKAESSRRLRSEFPSLKSRIPSLWNHAYFAVTLGTGETLSAGQAREFAEWIERQRAG
jgi:REP-associated tyrosine transposase